MKFEEWLSTLDLANLNDLQPNEGMEMGWHQCKEEVLKIINETPLGYITENEHIKLEKFADIIEDKVKKL